MKNEIEGFPQEVIDKMLERQVEQGNKRDITVFEKGVGTNMDFGGFDWSDTPEGQEFWSEVIGGEDFDLFFAKYPKNVYPKVMLVCDYNSPCIENWSQRVVFVEKCGGFLAWDGAETLEQAEKTCDVIWWKYAKDLPTVQEYTLEEIAKALGKPVESIRIKK